MKCDACGGPAIAAVTVDFEALDLTNWPEQWLEHAGTAQTAGMCRACFIKFLELGVDAAMQLGLPDAFVGETVLVGRKYTDTDGNTYTRTDRGWVLSDAPAGSRPRSPKGALGRGRKRPRKLN